MAPDDDITRLDITMENAPAVSVLDRIANVGKSLEEITELERPPARIDLQGRVGVEAVDGLFERIAFDQTHRVVRSAVAVGSEAVDRDDTRMLQPAGDFGFQHKARAASRIVGVTLENLLERDLAIQLGVERNEDDSQTPRACGRKIRNR